MTGAALPALRDDLQLFPQVTDAHDRASALIYDPVRHAYFRLSHAAMEIVSRWSAVREAAMQPGAKVAGLQAAAQDVEAVAAFLQHNQLLAESSPEALAGRVRHSRNGWATAAVHNYLFFRIPLVHPHRWLAHLAPLCGFLFARLFWIVLGVVACMSLYIVSREWDRFASDVAGQLQWSGLPLIVAVLAALKTVHELGHAIAATRYGCHVSTMGVAFMVLTPVLYTDTTDAWRVPQRRRRIVISTAGVMAEMIVAVAALCLWPFLAEGALRHAAVTAAVAAPLMTLAINLNPCMRFDGYFVLMDLLGVDNLQPRAFALARWRLREILFHPGDACPERMSQARQRLLTCYAWTVWIYRAVLFTGIALFVYAFFIKIVGIALFVVEIVCFVLLPVAREAMLWWKRRREFAGTRRTKITLSLFALLAFGLVFPWSTSVHLPAMLVHAEELALHAASPARIAAMGSLADGARVSRGDILLTLESPEIAAEIGKAHVEIANLRLRIARAAADRIEMEQLPVLRSSLQAREEKLAGVLRMREDLVLRAPADGVVVDAEPDLHPGRWIKPSLHIATLAAKPSLAVRALASETEVARIGVGDAARFVPSDGARAASDATVVEVDRINETWLSLEALAMQNGGSIQSVREPSGRLRPQHPVYHVRLAVQPGGGEAGSQAVHAQALRGVVVVDGRAESVATRIWRRIVRVAIRESGF